MTSTEQNWEAVVVIQADRDAAKALLAQQELRYHKDGTFRDWDNTVQAFARHRLAFATPSILDADTKALEWLDQATDLIQEAKGADGPNGGFVTDHLDFAEHWIGKVRERLSARQPADAAPAMDGWRDIASAPRDGTWLLLEGEMRGGDTSTVLIGRYEPLDGYDWRILDGRCCRFDDGDADPDWNWYPEGRVHQWMPMPAPPTDTVESGEKL